MRKTASEILNKAEHLLNERGKQYDQTDGERSMGKAVDAFNVITGRDLTESEGWLLMQILKDVRQWSSHQYHADSAEDCVAYAALKAESLARNDSNVGQEEIQPIEDDIKFNGAQHNPDNLTPEQVGVSDGWRLLDKDEILDDVRPLVDIEFFLRGNNTWSAYNVGDKASLTYRTKLSRDELRKARGIGEN